jgi:hypothetical protein
MVYLIGVCNIALYVLSALRLMAPVRQIGLNVLKWSLCGPIQFMASLQFPSSSSNFFILAHSFDIFNVTPWLQRWVGTGGEGEGEVS